MSTMVSSTFSLPEGWVLRERAMHDIMAHPPPRARHQDRVRDVNPVNPGAARIGSDHGGQARWTASETSTIGPDRALVPVPLGGRHRPQRRVGGPSEADPTGGRRGPAGLPRPPVRAVAVPALLRSHAAPVPAGSGALHD